MHRALITGVAGFIGSNLADRLLEMNVEVIGYDNLSTGQRKFIETACKNRLFSFREGDLLDERALRKAMVGCDVVFHFAANADVRFGTDHPRRDLEQNTIATHNVLEAMRAVGVNRVVFSSTGSVYGETQIFPTPEDAAFPIQTSLYGASKLAAEGLIAAYCEGFDFQSYVFRFVSILGERYSHGHVFDFYRQLRSDPSRLIVLGNGKQRKSYLYIQDCIDAIFVALERSEDKINIFNLGLNEYCEVNDSINWICNHLGVRPSIEYTGGERGWVGDNPFIFLDSNRIRSLGWRPGYGIRDGVVKTVDYLQANEWLFEARR